MATLEQVEKLRERANVSYDEAKAALDATGGDILEALIYLEKQGKVKPPEGNGYYRSDGEPEAPKTERKDRGQPREDGGESFTALLARFGRFCLRLLHKGNVNTFDVIKGNECKASVPVTVLVVLLIVAFWVVLPLIVIGLFFGLHYRFQGPDLGRNPVNRAMDSAADAAEDLKKSVEKDRR